MSELERIVTDIPGPRSRALAARLKTSEARGVTYLANDFPVFWESASGATVDDVDGNRFLDLTSAFGVAATGHANPAVARAIAEQARRLPHGMGDVHPSAVKTELIERLAERSELPQAAVFLASTGSEAVEFALKTALLATGKPNAIAFRGAYHGLAHGALEVGGLERFRKPFAAQLRNGTSFVDFPHRDGTKLVQVEAQIERALRADPQIGAIVVEPIQGRAGIVVPPAGFLQRLRRIADAHELVLVYDEIYTGFGRTGAWFAWQHEGIAPDIICVGKALGGGFPLSATIGSGTVMQAWPRSTGEALHTSTYLGNPMACAAGLANLAEMERLDVPGLARSLGTHVAPRLRAIAARSGARDVRGIGALWALELRDGKTAAAATVRALQRGLLLLQSGTDGQVIVVAPPLTMDPEQLERAFELLATALEHTA